jgi:hypothetical protein
LILFLFCVIVLINASLGSHLGGEDVAASFAALFWVELSSANFSGLTAMLESVRYSSWHFAKSSPFVTVFCGVPPNNAN